MYTFHPVKMLDLRIYVGLIICCSVQGSLYQDEISGRSLYRPSLQNKPVMGIDDITKEKKLDIVFVVDVSKAADINALKNFIIYTTKVLELEPAKTKVAVVPIPHKSTTKITLNEGTDHAAFKALVNSRLVTEQALFDLNNVPKYITLCLTPSNGGRNDAKKVIIMVAASFPSFAVVKNDLLKMKTNGYKFFVVGVSQNSVPAQASLESLVQNAKTDYLHVDNYNLLTTEKINEALIKAFGRDPCLPNLCNNKGKCVPIKTSPGYECQCPLGWKGTLCSQKDRCNPNPCNGGVCLDLPNQVKVNCTCIGGRRGNLCEKLSCTKYYCKNGGTCSDLTGKPICKCEIPYTPPTCETVLQNPCSANTCLNGGTCSITQEWKAQCSCPLPFLPPNCTTSMSSPCTPTTCLNGGTCYLSNWKPQCLCPVPFLPPDCSTSIPSPCTPTTCLNGGTCHPSRDWKSFTCACAAMFKGNRCQTLVVKPPVPTFCQKNPAICQNKGKCMDWGTTSSFKCDCSATNCLGDKCQICKPRSASPCSPSPCKGDCSCQVSNTHDYGYRCVSPSGLLGRNCEFDKPSVRCEPTTISISISQQAVQYFQQGQPGSVLIVGPTFNYPAPCSVTGDSSGNYIVTIPLNGCGSTSTNGASGITEVSNAMWIKSNDIAFSIPIPIFKFTCQYGYDDYKVVTSLKPGLAIAQTISSKISLRPTVVLCKSPFCPQTCPTGLTVANQAVYTVGQSIHLELALGHLSPQSQPISVPDVTSVKQLILSCSSYSNPGKDLVLVSGGCLTNSPKFPIKLQRSGLSEKACVSIKVPMIKPCSEIYIRATLQSCTQSNRRVCPDGTSYTCNTQTTGRKRRSVDDEDTGSVVIGPLLIVNGSRGSASVELYFNELATNVSVDKIFLKANYDSSSIFPAVGTTILWIILIVVVGLSLGLVLRLLSLRRW